MMKIASAYKTHLSLTPLMPMDAFIPERLLKFFRFSKNRPRPRVLSLCAPAAYGKSTLLAYDYHQCAQQGRQVAYLAFHSGSQDGPSASKAFLKTLSALPALFKTKDSNLNSIWKADDFIQNLAKLLTKLPQDLVLFLDNFDTLNLNLRSKLLEACLKGGLPNLSLCLASREKLSHGFQRYLSQGTWLNLEGYQLSFLEEETEDFLKKHHALKLNSGSLDYAYSQTQGWIKALEDLALELKNQSLDAWQAKEEKWQENLAAFFEKEVFLSQDKSLQDFLLTSSTFHQLASSNLEEINGLKKSQEYLEKLEMENIFISPVDRHRKAYVYHPLFRGFLQKRLTQKKLAFYKSLSHQASRYFWDKKDYQVAIDYALQVQDKSRALSLLDQGAEEIFKYPWSGKKLRKYLGALSYESLSSRPRVLVFFLLSQLLSNQLLTLSAKIFRQKAIESLRKIAWPELELLELLVEGAEALLEGEILKAKKAFNKIIDFNPPSLKFCHCLVYYYLALTETFSGNFEEAFRKAQTSIQLAHQALLTRMVHRGQALLLFILIAQSKFKEALAKLESFQTAVNSHVLKGENYNFAKLVIDYEQGQEMPSDFLKHELEDETLWLELDNGRVYGLLAKILFCQGTFRKAFKLLKGGEAKAKKLSLKIVGVHLVAERIFLLLRSQKIIQAQNLAQSQGFWEPGLSKKFKGSETWIRELQKIVQARLYLAQLKPQEALETIRPVVKRSKKLLCLRHRIEVLLIEGQALEQKQDRLAALRKLREALVLGEDESYIRVFIEAGPVLRDLFQNFYLQQIDKNFLSSVYLNKIASLWGLETIEQLTQKQEASDQQLSKKKIFLTKREQEILPYLDSALSMKQIAKRLFVSENTVKFHLKRVYKKLGVDKRSKAVAEVKKNYSPF